jgi:DNA adenine methylase
MKSSTHAQSRVDRPALNPLIKWPGGKRALAQRILQFVPSTFGTYYEPFFGGGAVFFSLQPRRAVLSDANPELINAYVQIRDAQEELLRSLRKLKNTEADYYAVRDSAPRTPINRASRMLYLTRLSFNGIHRVNLKGEFNVPYGYKTHLDPVDEEHLLSVAKTLKQADLRIGDFEGITGNAESGDVLYFDPPYTVAHANNGFVKYNERIFSWQDQERLAAHARTLADRGCRVIISNADHPSLRKLYEGFDCHVVKRFSVIAASGSHRREITECIFVLGDV